jgi:predicted nuclease of predicted toxin-antitoxin system
MQVVIDMNLSPDWTQVFLDHGILAKHWREVGPPNATDSEIFGWAVQHDSIVFTHDLDFATILAASGKSRPSVIQLRHANVDPRRHGSRIVHLLHQFSAELAQGALLAIEPAQHRVRLLPLRD